ncbi:MAG: hypothetical protein J0M33_11630 [Anaerolineae bacterium]|nr:hypothetical protein [Anaerolineae bacterium]
MRSIPEKFRTRLASYLDGNNPTGEPIAQDKLATWLGVSQTTVSRWLSGKVVPTLDDLEAMRSNLPDGDQLVYSLLQTYNIMSQKEGLTWFVSSPTATHDSFRQQVETGIQLFTHLVHDGVDLLDCASLAEFTGYSIQDLYTCFSSALRTGSLRLMDVRRHEGLESELMKLYGEVKKPGRTRVQQIIVADIPDFDGTPLRAEVVAFLAAKIIFDQSTIAPRVVGIGYGYTVARTAHYSHLYGQFSQARWVPLISFNPEYPVRFPVNEVAGMLQLLHPGSYAQQQRFPEAIQLTMPGNATFSPSHMLVTVNGFEPDIHNPRKPNESTNSYVDGHSRNWPYSPAWQYEQLKQTGQDRFVAGEFMGLLMDDDGQPVYSDTELLQTQSFSQQVDYRHQLYNLFSDRIWLIAAMSFKARAVRMALRNGLVGNVVIDRSIAKWLLANPAPL